MGLGAKLDKDDVAFLLPGDSVALRYNVGNRNNRTIHIRAIVDYEYFVIRTFRLGKWSYKLEYRMFFEISAESGNLYRGRRSSVNKGGE